MSMNHRPLIERWVELFNRADADALAQLYADDAVNHQVALAPVEGRDAIRQMFQSEFSQFEMVCIPENLFQDGEVVILEWRDPKGLRGCGFFWIRDGKIAYQRGYWDRLSMQEQQGS